MPLKEETTIVIYNYDIMDGPTKRDIDKIFIKEYKPDYDYIIIDIYTDTDHEYCWQVIRIDENI